MIPTQRVAYVALGPSPSGGLLLAVIRNDPSLTFDDNSLFLYERGSLETPWRDVGRLVQGGRMPVHNPQLSLDDSGAVITYSAGAGGFVNMEGRAQSFNAVVKPQAVSRSILRSPSFSKSLAVPDWPDGSVGTAGIR